MILGFKSYTFLSFFLLCGILFFSFTGKAQIRGKIFETYSRTPLPFVHISVNDGKYSFLSDIDGAFTLPIDSSIYKITFESYLHRSVTFVPDSASFYQPLIINMNKHLFFRMDNCTTDTANVIMRKVLQNKEQNETSHLKYLSYSTYNKATLTPNGVDKTNSSLNKIFDFFSLKFNTFKEKQHFLIIESVTNKKIYNKHHQKEVIDGAKSTILDVPSLFVQTTQVQAFSPYESFVTIGGKTYVSPLTNHSLARYSFTVLDTIFTSSDTVFVIKYNPYPHRKFDGLKGLLFINTKNYAVQYFTATSAVEKKLKMSAAQSYKYYPENKIWFPDRTKTVAFIEKSGESFIATLDTYVSNLNLNDFHNRKQFDEIVLEYPEHANKQDSAFWNEKRSVPLTLYDSNTYIYYDSADQKKFIQRTLKFGEQLYYGIISYKILDIDLHRIIDVNDLEGLRLGFGVHTNEKLSRRLKFGFYYGYGTKDKRSKFGADATYRFRNKPISINASIMDDVKEAGNVDFPFNRYQYSSENLRRIRLRIMDRVMKWENSISIHPLKFLDVNAAFAISKHSTTYDYQYKDKTDNDFYFSELKLGLRYALRERAIQLPSRRIPLDTKFPILYLLYTKGYNSLFKGEYNYHKYDLKLEYTLKFMNFGRTGVQVVTGMVQGDVPYAKLYNGNGSLRNGTVVIHNTFETMRYNEFLSDRHISFFISHNFGRLYFRNPRLRPSLLLLHNIGFGSLQNPEHHKNFTFKTMEKGYIETGMLLDNILTFNITGLKIGIGAGFFYRYGHYANPELKDNFVFKFATSFSL